MDTFISVGTTLLGSLFGKGVSKGTISQAGTSIKNYGKISKDEQTAQQAQDTLESYLQQIQDLQTQRDNELMQYNLKGDASQVHVEKVIVRPRKSDISIENVAMVWVPVIKK
jgi:hypothetical protein